MSNLNNANINSFKDAFVANEESKNSASRSILRTLAIVSTYLFSSISLVFISKEILVESSQSVPVPITLTLAHMLINSILLVFLGLLGERFEKRDRNKIFHKHNSSFSKPKQTTRRITTLSFIPSPEFDRKKVKDL